MGFRLRDHTKPIITGISDKVKVKRQIEYKQNLARIYFWRTKQQQEVDFVEEKGGKIFGYEFKWNKKRNSKLPKTFTDTYNAGNSVINKDNFREFMLIK